MSSPVTVADLLQRNTDYVSRHTPAPFLSEFEKIGKPAPAVAVVTCADPRCVPETFFDLKPTEVIVLRTAGGRVKPVLNDLMYLDGLLSLKGIMVIHHNDCGKSFMTDDEARSALKKALPTATGLDSIEFGTFKDSSLEQSVMDDILLLKQFPLLRKELSDDCFGFTYDVKTGRLTAV
ncbi:MAG: hypothetical protein M1821_006541 [Bathelium mastoideum]|nr:MAG: hypothetical protein M1821_006541 [Bathelium mastoideum]